MRIFRRDVSTALIAPVRDLKDFKIALKIFQRPQNSTPSSDSCYFEIFGRLTRGFFPFKFHAKSYYYHRYILRENEIPTQTYPPQVLVGLRIANAQIYIYYLYR